MLNIYCNFFVFCKKEEEEEEEEEETPKKENPVEPPQPPAPGVPPIDLKAVEKTEESSTPTTGVIGGPDDDLTLRASLYGVYFQSFADKVQSPLNFRTIAKL